MGLNSWNAVSSCCRASITASVSNKRLTASFEKNKTQEVHLPDDMEDNAYSVWSCLSTEIGALTFSTLGRMHLLQQVYRGNGEDVS